MIIYIIMLIISLFLAKYFEKNRKIAALVSFLPFFIISAIRFDVGTDYMYRYVPDYLRIFYYGDAKYLEYTFKIFYKICILLVGKNYQIIFIITSFFINALIFKTIYQKSKNPIFSIIIFFISGFFFQSLNIVRQYLAMSIVFAGYKFLEEKKYKTWMIICILAISIHISSAICISFIVLKNMKIINLKFLLILTFLYFIFDDVIAQIVERIISVTRFAVYSGSNYDVSGISKTLLITNIILYLYMWYSYMIKLKNNELDEDDKFFLNIQAFTIIIAILGNIIMLFSRMVFYFQIFQIISIPNFIYGFKNKFNQKIIASIIITLFVVLFVRSNIINNYNEVVPYKTIFNAEVKNYDYKF